MAGVDNGVGEAVYMSALAVAIRLSINQNGGQPSPLLNVSSQK